MTRAVTAASTVALTVAAHAAPARAQQTPAQPRAQAAPAGATVSTRRCPVLNGIRIAVVGADTGRRGGVTLDGRTTLDTTFTLDIAERRWTEPRLTASLEAGVGDTTRARWHACTGVSITMHDVTLVLREVRGQVRYRVDLSPLLNVARLGATPAGRPRQ